jgi:hypothetical protein
MTNEEIVELQITSLDDLYDWPRWVAWREESRRTKNGQTKRTKVPYASPGRRAEIPTNPTTWTTRDGAERCWQRFENGRTVGGVGVVLGDLGNGWHLWGIDLDGCIDPDSGRILEWADEILQRFDSYAEISPSGRGIKLFFLLHQGDLTAALQLFGTNTEGQPKTRKAFAVDEHREIAIDRARFYAVTEQQAEGAPPTLRLVSVDDLDWLLNVAGPEYLAMHGKISRKERNKQTHVRDESGSGHGFRFMQKCKREGDGFLRAKIKILDDPGPAGGWARERADERQLRRAYDNEGGGAARSKGEDEEEPRPLTTRSLDQFEWREVRWLWWPFVPLRELTAFYGEGEVGKTSIGFDLAARVSTGAPMPQIEGEPEEQGGEPSTVLIISQEDDPNTVVAPQVAAAGADLSRVELVGYERPDNPDEFDLITSLHDKLPEIETIIRERGDVGLIIIDPISDFTGGKDTAKDDQVRALLNPLRDWARRYDLAIIFCLHVNKKEDLMARHRALGSVAFTNVPRSVVLVAPDPDDETGNRRYMVQDKKNLTPPGKRALGFCLVATRGGPKQIKWEGAWDPKSADDVLAKRKGESKLDRAKRMLTDMLADGSRWQTEIVAAARAGDITMATLRRAKDDMDVVSKQDTGGGWYWDLPA